MCASQNMPVYINYKRYNGNDPKINRALPLPQGNHVAKFGKDPIYRTKVIVRTPVWTPARMPACPPYPITEYGPSRDGRIISTYYSETCLNRTLNNLTCVKCTPVYSEHKIWFQGDLI